MKQKKEHGLGGVCVLPHEAKPATNISMMKRAGIVACYEAVRSSTFISSRSAFRYDGSPHFRVKDLGFRVVASPFPI